MAAPTTAATVKIAIAPMSGPVPACKPNLMPFHISYNGPAAVNAFMHVEKLVDDTKRAETHGCHVQTDQSPEGLQTVSAETQALQATTTTDTLDIPLTLTRTTTESTLVTESSLTTLAGSNSDVSVPSSSSFSQIPINPQDFAPPIEDLDKRFTSTFRGRSIHGLTINLPDGYAGLVLKSTGAQPDGRGGVQRTKGVDVDVESESLGHRRKGRLRSSAAPRKGTVITISDDDSPQSSNALNSPDSPYQDDVEMADPLPIPNGPRRILVPTARFDAFTLWQADRIVNKSNDEYYRTLTEWIGLAHEIHNVDV